MEHSIWIHKLIAYIDEMHKKVCFAKTVLFHWCPSTSHTSNEHIMLSLHTCL